MIPIQRDSYRATPRPHIAPLFPGELEGFGVLYRYDTVGICESAIHRRRSERKKSPSRSGSVFPEAPPALKIYYFTPYALMKKNTSVKIVALIIVLGIIASFLVAPVMYFLDK